MTVLIIVCLPFVAFALVMVMVFAADRYYRGDIVSPRDALQWKALVDQHDERLTAPLKAEIAALRAEVARLTRILDRQEGK